MNELIKIMGISDIEGFMEVLIDEMKIEENLV